MALMTEVIPVNENQGFFYLSGNSNPVVAAYNHQSKTITVLLRAQAYGIVFPINFNDYKIINLTHDKEFQIAHI